MPLVEIVEEAFDHVDVPTELWELMRKHDELDIADALQLLALLKGPIGLSGGQSRATLVTTVQALKEVALANGILVYDPDHDGYPSPKP